MIQTRLIAPYLYPQDTQLAIKDAPAKRRLPVGPRAAAIVSHLQSHPRSTSRSISEALAWDVGLTRATLKRLLDHRRVTLTEERTKTRNAPFRFFSNATH